MSSAKHRKRRNTVYNQEKKVDIVFIYQIAMLQKHFRKDTAGKLTRN